ncbi:P-loop containing nucleoside triphosphate hydrolase protein, partial [Paraphysoderma sedebokerense]
TRYAVTVFAFGQTGSGKTFTMTGPDDAITSENQGLVPRSLRYIYEQIDARTSFRYTVKAAYLEIYNEQVQDLLNPSSTSLNLRWSREKGFYVENLFIVVCEILDDCMAVLEEGLRNRKTGSHALNERSSRSHTILTLHLDYEICDPDDNRIRQVHGKISFVDLAGSERVKESKTSGDMLTETFNINKSLLTLGNCISALSDSKRRIGHIPYRDSKLTKLLMDSLGGNGMALMISCISPSANNLSETLKTLRYASRAKKIRNRPVVQIDPKEAVRLYLVSLLSDRSLILLSL